MKYAVKLNFWASPTEIEADNEQQAKALATYKFPKCDCGCNELTKVESVEQAQ